MFYVKLKLDYKTRHFGCSFYNPTIKKKPEEQDKTVFFSDVDEQVCFKL